MNRDGGLLLAVLFALCLPAIPAPAAVSSSGGEVEQKDLERLCAIDGASIPVSFTVPKT